MTTVTINHSWFSAFLDVEGHAGDHDLCTIISTIANMVAASLPEGVEPDIYTDGRVMIKRDVAERRVIAVMEVAEMLFKELEEEFPDKIKVI